MRLTIDLEKEDIEELLYINVNYRICRRLLLIIRACDPDLCDEYNIKWRDVKKELAMTYFTHHGLSHFGNYSQLAR